MRPTLFADVNNRMTIARDEIFGPVLCVIPYRDEAEAIAIANDTDYGLSAMVLGGDVNRARRVAQQIVSGRVLVNTWLMNRKHHSVASSTPVWGARWASGEFGRLWSRGRWWAKTSLFTEALCFSIPHALLNITTERPS